MSDRLTIQDCQAAGYCVIPGVRDWCRAHNIDFRDFVKNGMDLDAARAMNDGMANRAIQIKEQRNGR